MTMDSEARLLAGDLELVGQLVQASNATFLVRISGHEPMNAVYKPIAGETPLWDFPDGPLAHREIAAFRLSRLLSWDLVPVTVLRDGPFGTGMVQEWIEIDPSVDVIELVQSHDPRLAHLALFDALINNTDRKVGHILPIAGRVLGCDHGVSFHHQDKLRTVLWQFRGEPIPSAWLADLEHLQPDAIRDELKDLLSEEDLTALFIRRERLLRSALFPQPSPDWPAVPWPPI